MPPSSFPAALPGQGWSPNMARDCMRAIRYQAPAKVIGVQADLFGGKDVELVAAPRAVPATWTRDVARYNRAIVVPARATRPLYLVGCVKTKGPGAVAAADLYTSDWFLKARAYVETLGAEWRILSAEHGLVAPGQVIAPYERTLSLMSSAARDAWGKMVLEQLAAVAGAEARPLVLLAGEHYRQPIQAWAGARAVAPMAGLGLGSQKAWLVAQTTAIRSAGCAAGSVQC